jgi:hypothetical protein
VHSSGLVQIRVWNVTPKNKVRTSPILMRGLNDKNPLNYLLQRLISPFWRLCQEILPEVFNNLFLAWQKPQESVKSKTSEANSSSCHGPCSHAPHLQTFHCSNWNAKAALLWALQNEAQNCDMDKLHGCTHQWPWNFCAWDSSSDNFIQFHTCWYKQLRDL